MPSCEVCQKPANQTCGGCKSVFYCSKAHQKIGWKDGHKINCRPFKVEYSKDTGRYLVATRDIKQGEVILREKPAVGGPKMACHAQCLSCARKLEPIQNGDTLDFYKCSRCNWPMCNLECEKSEVHREECKVMTINEYKCDIKYDPTDKGQAAYCVIVPLRVLLMKHSNPELFESIMNLESHLKDRIHTQLYQVLKANLVTFVVQVLKLPFDEETILTVASIIDTNSFDVRYNDSSIRLRGIYVAASMMNHSCRPNTRHIFTGSDHTMLLITTVPIKKGEELTATYTQSLWGTLDRRKHLKTVKYFDCCCERCSDVTEFETYIGSIYCSICNNDNRSKYLKTMMLSTNSLNETASWKCDNCGHTIQSKQMFWGNNALKLDLKNINKSKPKDFEDFIQSYNKILHPKNHIIVQAKLALMQIYGNYDGYTLSELSENLLKRKIDICYELLEIAEKLEPGWTKFRGTILLELQAALVMQTKRDFEAEKLTKDGAQELLMESMALLQESVQILKVEPEMKDILEQKVYELTTLMDSTSTG